MAKVSRRDAIKTLGAAALTAGAGDWSKLRDTWEYSHVARAVFAMLSLLCLSIAVTA